MKRDLDSLEQKADGRIEGEEDAETGPSRAEKRVTPNISLIYKRECIFCEKDKYVRSPNSREKLVKAIQLRVDETLRNIATEKCDHKIMVNE